MREGLILHLQQKYDPDYHKLLLAFDLSDIPKQIQETITGVLQVVNRGNIPIYGFDIKQIKGGESKRTPFPYPVSAGETIPGKDIVLFGDADKLEMYPIILGGVEDKTVNKQYTCLSHPTKINLI